MDDRAMLRLASKAMANGGVRVGPLIIEWDISGRCEASVGRDVTLKRVGERRRFRDWQSKAAKERRSGVVYLIKPAPPKVLPLGFTVRLTVRCRKCKTCRQARASMWRARAISELKVASRTWFGTLTLNPHEQFRLLTAARAKLNRQGIDYDALGDAEKFRIRVSVASPDITKYIKRVREQSKAPLRYLWVSEAHKSGSPHFHALFHETDIDRPILHRILRDQWIHGFTRWKLVESLPAGTYLTKYLSKSAASRIRASVDYGSTASAIANHMNGLRDFVRSADPQTSSYTDAPAEVTSGSECDRSGRGEFEGAEPLRF